MLTDKEKEAVRQLAAYFDACNGECGTCDFPEKGRCLPAHASIAKKMMRL